MPSHTMTLRAGLFLAILLGIIFTVPKLIPPPTPITAQNNVAAVAHTTPNYAATTTLTATVATSTSTPATSTSRRGTIKPTTSVKKVTKATRANASTTTTPVQIARLENLYDTSPSSFETINSAARGALVNILCRSDGASLKPISGSGVIIDPRGVILTNAHVAQYVLLAESGSVNLSCAIRSGSPAKPLWRARVLYIPSVWVAAHAKDINAPRPTGTGEHDYALLTITGALDDSPIPAAFPYLSVDTREKIGFFEDQVLAASYPAELVGGITAQNDLYPVSSVTVIRQLLTFLTGTVDVVSLGGVIEAQGGSSGGAVVNAWGKLIALIATTSEGATTADRDLRAVTLSYINTDLVSQTGQDLKQILFADISRETVDFANTTAPALVQQYVTILSK